MKKGNKKSYSTVRDLPTFDANPFVENALIKIEENTVQKRRFVKNTKGVEQTIVNKDGEVTGHTAFLQMVEVDEDKFAKLYLSQFAAFWDLPKAAIRVFGYIITCCLFPKKDSFFIDIDEALEYTKYSSSKYINNGIAALVNAGIIAKSNRLNKYFINPLVVFNGDRVTFAKTYVRKRKKKVEDDPRQKKMDFWDQSIDSGKIF
jgi:hypothetical protein